MLNAYLLPLAELPAYDTGTTGRRVLNLKDNDRGLLLPKMPSFLSLLAVIAAPPARYPSAFVFATKKLKENNRFPS